MKAKPKTNQRRGKKVFVPVPFSRLEMVLIKTVAKSMGLTWDELIVQAIQNQIDRLNGGKGKGGAR